MKKRSSNVFNLEDITKILGFSSPDSVWDNISENSSKLFHDVLSYEREQGKSEEEAERLAAEAESAEMDEHYGKWCDAVVKVFEVYLEQSKLEARKKIRKNGAVVWEIFPKTDWKDALSETRYLVNGISGFYFSSDREFLDSGPYTPREGVLQHFPYVFQRWNLEGDFSPSHRLNTLLR